MELDVQGIYNMDLRTGKRVALKQMLGADYAELVNESIREQIAERQKAGEIFFTAEEGGFAGISEDIQQGSPASRSEETGQEPAVEKAEAVFTDELLESIKNADVDHFQPCMAGFSISGGGQKTSTSA
ncbi:MAG: hypothetical protein HFI98_05890 [Lachnospiraceae bacterium]|nr:hypothetical protein [Lachnospiraceae bacterium]